MIAMPARGCVSNTPSIDAIFAGWKRATFSAWNDPVGKSDTTEKMSPAVTPTRTNVRPSASCFRASR